MSRKRKNNNRNFKDMITALLNDPRLVEKLNEPIDITRIVVMKNDLRKNLKIERIKKQLSDEIYAMSDDELFDLLYNRMDFNPCCICKRYLDMDCTNSLDYCKKNMFAV